MYKFSAGEDPLVHKLRIVIELYYIFFSRKAFQVRVTRLLRYLQLIRCSGVFFLVFMLKINICTML
jgi:hypothetical protein